MCGEKSVQAQYDLILEMIECLVDHQRRVKMFEISDGQSISQPEDFLQCQRPRMVRFKQLLLKYFYI
jgi:hypothetical protein